MLANPRANVYISVESAHCRLTIAKTTTWFPQTFILLHAGVLVQLNTNAVILSRDMRVYGRIYFTAVSAAAPLKRSGLVNAGLEAHQEPQADNNQTL